MPLLDLGPRIRLGFQSEARYQQYLINGYEMPSSELSGGFPRKN
jgi:hypothetical protein